MPFLKPDGTFDGSPDPRTWATVDGAIAAMRAAADGASLMIWPEAGQMGAFIDPMNGDGVIYEKLTDVATFSRASKAWHPNWDFVSGSRVGPLVEYAAGQPVVGPGGLLVTSQVDNLLPNPRGGGSAFPAAPTGWALGGIGEFIGRGTQDGWPYVDIVLNGTLSGELVLVLMDNIAAVAADVFTSSVGVLLRGGTSGANPRLAVMSSAGVASSVEMPVDAFHRRWHVTGTIPSGATTARNVVRFQVGTYANAYFRIFCPQFTKTAYPCPPVLPAAGVPASATKPLDNCTIPIGGWYQHSAGTLCIEFLSPVEASPSVTGIAALEGSDVTNMRGIVVSVAVGRIVGRTRVAGQGASDSNQIILPPRGTRIITALSWNGTANRIAVNGSVGSIFTGGSGTTPTRLNIGNGTGTTPAPSHAPIHRLRYFPRAMSDAELAALTRPYWS